MKKLAAAMDENWREIYALAEMVEERHLRTGSKVCAGSTYGSSYVVRVCVSAYGLTAYRTVAAGSSCIMRRVNDQLTIMNHQRTISEPS